MLPAFAAERVAADVEPRMAGAVATERRTPPVPASVIFVTKTKTRTRIIGLCFKKTRTRTMVVLQTKTK